MALPLMLISLFSSANAAYKAAQYDKAIEAYSQVRAQGLENAELYYNLGNAHYKLGHTSQAILNYERALKLQPTDEDAQHNLRLVTTKIVDRVARVPQLAIVSGWQNFVHGRSAKGWSICFYHTRFGWRCYFLHSICLCPRCAGWVFM